MKSNKEDITWTTAESVSEEMPEIKVKADEETKKNIPEIAIGTLLEIKSFRMIPNPLNTSITGTGEIITIRDDRVVTFRRYQSSNGDTRGEVIVTYKVTAKGWWEAVHTKQVLFKDGNLNVFYQVGIPDGTNCSFDHFAAIDKNSFPPDLFDAIKDCGIITPQHSAYRC